MPTSELVKSLSDAALIELGVDLAKVMRLYEQQLRVVAEEYDPVRTEILRRGLWFQMPKSAP